MKKSWCAADPKLLQGDGNEVTAKLMIELTDGQRIERLASLEQGKAQKWIGDRRTGREISPMRRPRTPRRNRPSARSISPFDLDSAKICHRLMELVGARA